MVEIDKEMTIMELLTEDPNLELKLKEIGLGCGGCPMSQLETIEMGALGHGLDPNKVVEELSKNINKLNKMKSKDGN